MKSVIILSVLLLNFLGLHDAELYDPVVALSSIFSDGEINVTLTSKEVNDHVIIIADLYPNQNQKIIELMFTIDAAKRAGARTIDLLVPYMPYARADRTEYDRAGSLGAKVLLDMIYNAGVKKITTLDMHNPSIEGFFNGTIKQIDQEKALCDESVLIVYPDQSAFKKYHKLYKRHKHLTIEKVRDSLGMIITSNILSQEVANMECMIVDDVISTGNTLFEVAEKLKNAGAKKVSAYVTHSVLCDDAIKRLEASCIDELQTTDSIAIKRDSKKIKVKNVIKEFIKKNLDIYSGGKF